MILLASEEGAAGFGLASRMLFAGADIMDAIEAGIRAVESDATQESVGLGGLPNAAGFVELDAGIMDGANRRSGAVEAVRGCPHPISVARALLETDLHALLVGEGARAFAIERGLEHVPLSCETARGPLLAQSAERLRRPGNHDTIVFIGSDRAGHFAAGASTSGLAGKFPGRVGDSAVVGAGFYAVDGLGAAGCTGVGEMTIRCAAARAVVESMVGGHDVGEAVRRVLDHAAMLTGGLIGGLTLHAVDAREAHFVGTLRRQSKGYFLSRPGREVAHVQTIEHCVL